MKQPYTIEESDDGYYEVHGPGYGYKRDEDPPLTYPRTIAGAAEALAKCHELNTQHHVEQNKAALMDLYAAFQSGTFYDNPRERKVLIEKQVYTRGYHSERYTHLFELPHTLQYYLDRGLLETVPGAMSNTMRITRLAARLVAPMKWVDSPVAKAFQKWYDGLR